MGGGLKSKASQACETCRALKVRCLPSSQPDKCLKCAHSKKVCLFVERPPRQRQRQRQHNPKHSSKARICALESKVDKLIALASQSQLIYELEASQRDMALFGNESFTSSSPEKRVSTSDNSYDSNSDSTPFTLPLNEWAGYPQLNGTSCPELLLECGLSIDAAETFLIRFRAMISYFPFFVLPSHATVLIMCKKKPFTLLAALAAAIPNKKLQKSLGHKFKTCALHAVMIDNERSLDLLNGFLIYLAWYQFYYVPKKEQFNQLLHISIGLVEDMGLNLRPSDAMSGKAGLRLTHYGKALAPCTDHDEFFSREARRAYLGCFYLSSIAGWITAKPNSVHFQKYVIECADSLSQELEYPTDASLLPLIQLQHMAEVNHRKLSTACDNLFDLTNSFDIEMKVQSFQAELARWKDSLPLVRQQQNVIELACGFAEMHAYEMDLVNMSTAKWRRRTDSLKDPINTSSTSAIRLEILFLCLKSAGQLALKFLSIPTSEYSSLSYIQWSGLIYAINIIYRLTVGNARLRNWDIRVARSTIDFGWILDTFCSRFDDGVLLGETSFEDEDLFSLMGPIFENVKQTYNRLKHLSQNDSADDMSPVHATSFFPSAPKHQHPCPALQTWREMGTASQGTSTSHPTSRTNHGRVSPSYGGGASEG